MKMRGKPEKTCCCVVNGQTITPDWLVKHKAIKYKTAQHRIYEYNRGNISVATLLAYGRAEKNKGQGRATEEWLRLGNDPRPLTCAPAGTWESKNIPEPAAKPVKRRYVSQDESPTPAYAHGQFRFNLRGAFA